MAYSIEWIDQCNGQKKQAQIPTPAGLLSVGLCDDVICYATWEAIESINESVDPALLLSSLEINHTQDTLPIKLLRQGTLFQHSVWAEMANIPWGHTLTYSEIAHKISSAPRAVGNACRANPYPWLIPCHRVVAVSGLGGYSGQTVGPLMAIKEKLLSYESATKS